MKTNGNITYGTIQKKICSIKALLAVIQTDYLKEAELAKTNTLAYLRQVEAIVNTEVTEIKWRQINCFGN